VSAPQVPIEDTTLESFRTVIDTNLTGSFLFTRAAIRAFKAQSPPGGTACCSVMRSG
jgi:NAD(P)-dependent dehydrogenase (short-subunit alcohol dehydrogenase family)